MVQLAPVLDRALVPPQELAAPALSARAVEVAWAGGLFEGQGALELRLDGSVLLSLASTDKDVIDRFRSAVGAGRLCSEPPGRNRRRKWRLDIVQVEDVLRVITLLYPWLGERRKARADEVVAILCHSRWGTEVARNPSPERLL